MCGLFTHAIANNNIRFLSRIRGYLYGGYGVGWQKILWFPFSLNHRIRIKNRAQISNNIGKITLLNHSFRAGWTHP